MWGDDRLVVPSMMVVETLPLQKATGILSPAGNMIYSTERKNPIGFVWFTEDEDGSDSTTLS